MDCDKLQREIERLKYEKPRLAVWREYDQMRLDAYEEVIRLTGLVHALRNRLQDDRATPMLTEKVQ